MYSLAGISFSSASRTATINRRKHEQVFHALFCNARNSSGSIDKAAICGNTNLPRIIDLDSPFINSPRGLALIRAYGVLDPPTMASLVLELFNASILSYSSLQASEFSRGLCRVLSAGHLAPIGTLSAISKLMEQNASGEGCRSDSLTALLADAQDSLLKVKDEVRSVLCEVNEHDPEYGMQVLVTVLYQTIRYDMPLSCADVFYTAWYGMLKCVLENDFADVTLKTSVRTYARALTKPRPWWLNKEGGSHELAGVVLKLLDDIFVRSLGEKRF
jgi:hypothetical protein